MVGNIETGMQIACNYIRTPEIMKKAIKISTILFALLCVLTQLSGISHAGPTGVAGSKHDMSVFYLNTKFTGGAELSSNPFRFETEQVCVFCHTPHNANTAMREDTYWNGSTFTTNGTSPNDQPIMLWNRDVGSAATVEMRLYASSSMQSATGQVWTYSLMCLSCHDGVSAINVLHRNPSDYPFGGAIDPGPDNPGGLTRFGDVLNLPANIGGRNPTSDDGITHLEDDHPISINYSTAKDNDPGLIAENPAGYVQDERIRLFPVPGLAGRGLGASKVAMECSTCHDVHNEGSPDPGAPADVALKYPFLAVTTAGSYLCRQCHNK